MRSWNPGDDPDKEHVQIQNVIPVAGNFMGAKPMDAKFTRLKSTDSELEGLQLTLDGGLYNKMKQRAVIQFICDKTRTGNEGNEAAILSLPEGRGRVSLARRADEDKNDDEKDDDARSLQFVSYGRVEGKEDVDLLRLNWRTKYACEDFEDDDDGDDDDDDDKKAGWGFFTWFILM